MPLHFFGFFHEQDKPAEHTEEKCDKASRFSRMGARRRESHSPFHVHYKGAVMSSSSVKEEALEHARL